MSIFNIFSSLGSLFSSDIDSPSVNIDGTPMIPDTNIDVHGNLYGVTDSFNGISSGFDNPSTFDSLNSFDS